MSRRARPDPNPVITVAPSIDIHEIVVSQVSDALFATDLDNIVTFWGGSAERLFGYTSEEAIGRPFGELLPYQMANPAEEDVFFATIRAGRTWRGSGRVRLRDGSELWIESTVAPIVVGGEVRGSVSVSRDITETIAVQRRLVAQERFVDAILDVAGALVLVLDRDGLVVRFNRACERLSGYTDAEVVGRSVWDLLIPPSEVDGVRAAVAELQDRDATGTMENHWVTRDGRRRLIAWSNTSLTDEAGSVTHVIGVGIDVTDERRSADALHGIESIGRLLASEGPTPETLDSVLQTLADRMSYPFLTLHLADAGGTRLGAQRGYGQVPAELDTGMGIVGRVVRTGLPAFVRDVGRDPDYLRVDDRVTCEIAVPLLGGGETLGVLLIESTGENPLEEADLRFALAVADRLSSALVLGRQQQALRERARLFAALTEFAAVANAILESERLWPALVEAAHRVIPVDAVWLATLDRGAGVYQIRAVRGIDQTAVGTGVTLGEGAAGRAILSRTTVATRIERSSFAEPVRTLVPADIQSVVAVPMIHEGAVLGAIVMSRAGVESSFSELEREVLGLVGSHAALAVANAHLVEEVSELAIHDGLTGLYNRRHFDGALDHIMARYRRDRAAGGRLCAVMFDLDHFGQFNRDHGHLAGDAVLRVFAGILRERLRSSDLVARYGGEEFVAILESCSLQDGLAVAEEVRRELESRAIPGPDGQQLHATVSAGCATLDAAEPTKEALLRTADVGLFMAKRAGRNQVAAA